MVEVINTNAGAVTKSKLPMRVNTYKNLYAPYILKCYIAKYKIKIYQLLSLKLKLFPSISSVRT